MQQFEESVKVFVHRRIAVALHEIYYNRLWKEASYVINHIKSEQEFRYAIIILLACHCIISRLNGGAIKLQFKGILVGFWPQFPIPH